MIRVLLADSSDSFRRTLRSQLNSVEDIRIVGPGARTGEDAVRRAIASAPDLVLVDARIPPGGSLEVSRRLTGSPLRTRIVFMTNSLTDPHLLAGLADGVRGFMLKDESKEGMLRTLQAVRRGEMAVSDRLAGAARRAARVTRSPAASSTLSARELDVLRALCEHPSTDAAIAARLNIQSTSVKGHLRRIKLKTTTDRRADLVAWAFRNGVVS